MSAKYKKTRYTLAFLFLALLAIGLWWRQQPAEVPDLKLTAITGEKITVAQIPGPALVVFWATDCPACLQEIPLLTKLWRTYHGRGLEILAIAMAYDPPNRVVTFSRKRQLPYPVILDPFGEIASAFGGVRLVPTQLLIANGKILWRQTGILQESAIRGKIETLLTSTQQGAA